MKDNFNKTIDVMVNNYLALEKAFPWEPNLSRHFVALIFAQKENKIVEVDQIKKIVDTIKKETGWFSIYRGTFKFMLAALLVQQYSNPTEQFTNMLKNHDYLKSVGFKSNSYLPIANYALLITSGIDSNQVEVQDRARKAYDIYINMKKNHPWLTSGDDYPLAVLLAEFNNPIERIELYYKSLNERGKFYKGGSLQLLSHILSFSDEPVLDVVERCIQLQITMKNNKLNIQPSFYSALGIISLLKEDTGELVRDFIDVALYLNKLKKYKWLGKGMNILLASALVSSEWIQDAQLKNTKDQLLHTAMSVSIETIIAAQTAATIAAISASTAAATSASSS